jgi:hypothetical protein
VPEDIEKCVENHIIANLGNVNEDLVMMTFYAGNKAKK